MLFDECAEVRCAVILRKPVENPGDFRRCVAARGVCPSAFCDGGIDFEGMGGAEFFRNGRTRVGDDEAGGADGVSERLLGFRSEGEEDLPDCPDALCFGLAALRSCS